MITHYCHNCGHHSELPDGTYCAYCLGHFARHARLPRATDIMVSETSLTRLYQTLDRMNAS